jgi:O-antigen ligase
MVGIVAVLFIFAAAGSVVAGTETIWERLQEPDSYHLRAQLSRSTFEMIGEHPWTGFGLGTWRAVYPRFAKYDDALIANEAHNDLAQWGSDCGIPFVVIMLALVAWLARPAAKSIWGLGILATIFHCYVDYALRAPSLTFLWFALAGGVAAWGVSGARRRTERSSR